MLILKKYKNSRTKCGCFYMPSGIFAVERGYGKRVSVYAVKTTGVNGDHLVAFAVTTASKRRNTARAAEQMVYEVLVELIIGHLVFS